MYILGGKISISEKLYVGCTVNRNGIIIYTVDDIRI